MTDQVLLGTTASIKRNLDRANETIASLRLTIKEAADLSKDEWVKAMLITAYESTEPVKAKSEDCGCG